MIDRSLRIVVLALATVLVAGACSDDTASVDVDPPAVKEATDQEGISRITLTARAAERLGLETGSVDERSIDGTRSMVMPYGALIYDPDGSTWAYTNPAELTYIRTPLTVDRVDGDDVILVDGPAPGTPVVSVGAAELYGIEYGIGK